jgi:hypothetical protein
MAFAKTNPFVAPGFMAPGVGLDVVSSISMRSWVVMVGSFLLSFSFPFGGRDLDGRVPMLPSL